MITFHKHNEGRNWRRAEFNHECWLLLLGFPNDYWSERHVQNAVGSFARVILWEADDKFLNCILVRESCMKIWILLMVNPRLSSVRPFDCGVYLAEN